MRHEEIEVKFILDDVPAMRQRLYAIGATLLTPRTYEDNLRLDTPDRQLARTGALLRLRRDQRHVLTYKAPALQEDSHFKVRQEYEVEVSDVETLGAIFAQLGLTPSWRYEKYRETFAYQDATVVLDEVPCGTFMEIEGSRDLIRSLAAMLGLDFASRLVASYGKIFDAVCRTYHLAVTDMTFENFRGLQIDLHACHLR